MYLKAPAGSQIGAQVILADGTTKTIDAQGGITVANAGMLIVPLLNAGWVPAEDEQGLPNTLFTVDSSAISHSLVATAMGPARFVTVNMTGAAGAGVALTLPTVAQLVTQLAGFGVALFGCVLRIINSGNASTVWTVTTAAGWTLTGTMTIAQNTFRDFQLTLQSAAAATLQQIGTGTTS